MTGIAVNRSHSCGVALAGQAYCWGANTHGELGDGTNGQTLNAGKVGGTFVFDGVTVGRNHTCGLTTTNEIYCWGNNSSGQVGDGSTNEQHLPVRVTLPP